LVFAWLLIFLLMRLNLNSLVPNYENVSLGVAFVVGLVASISTCLAVTWGFIIWYNESVYSSNPLRTQLKFHIGRVVLFIVWWWILGLVGSQFWGSVWFNIIFSVLVGIVLLYLGLQLLGIVPNITKRWFHLPSWLSKTIFNLKDPKYAGIVWALTFFLPCGFTQSMQLFALQSGSVLEWALIMWSFALGTLPVLFWLWLGVKYIKDKLTYINPLIASLLVVFGVYTMYNSAALVNAMTIWDQETVTNMASQNNDIEIIEVWHDGLQFVPRSIKLPVGKNYKLLVTPTANGRGCMSQVVIPGEWFHAIKQWEKFEIYVDGSAAKTIRLVCASMWMKQWEIVVK
jgi:sulfite exporter TauE/SafE